MLTVTIETGNAAFDGDPRQELARILHDLATDLANGDAVSSGKLRDSNGNTVGTYVLTDA